jgi:hypothetical protein
MLTRGVLQAVWSRMNNLPSDTRRAILNSLAGSQTSSNSSSRENQRENASDNESEEEEASLSNRSKY